MKISLLIVITISVLCSSCNFLALVDRKQEKKFERNDIHLYKFQDENGVHAVHYTNNGKPKLMMLHGYGASGIGQYYRTSLMMREDYDLILPDLLYCGKSTGDSVDYSIDAQVAHIKTILDSLKIDESVAVIGNSYGGIVAAYFAERYPSLVNKLVIYDSPVNFYAMTYADSLAKSLRVESVRNLVSPVSIYETHVALDIIFYDQPYVPRFLRRQMVKYGSMPVRDNQLKLLEYLIEKEKLYNEHIFKWKMPVYIAWGDHDVLIPMSTCNSIASFYKISPERVHIFKNAAHAANVEYPKEFVKYVKRVMSE